jgi:RNA polymerase sigma-70 factor (ECF subfamily)
MELHDTGTPHLPTAENEWAFEQVFKTNFKGLHAYAYTIIREDAMAEEVVQNVFCRLWEKTGQLQVKESVTAYLYRAVYNESLNYLKHRKVKTAYQSYSKHHMNQSADEGGASKKLMLRDLEEKLGKALAELPQQCCTIFQMSRFEELKYQEIADKLGISIKTVENQMGKALRLLRLKLVDFLPVLLLLLSF